MNTNFKKGFSSICVKDAIIDGLSAHVPPIYATSTFTYENIDEAINYFEGKIDKFAYSRLGNPTTQLIADKIAALESYNINDDNNQPLDSFGLLFGSGMAAISCAIIANIKNGEKILTQGNLYGTTNELMVKNLQNFGIQTIYGNLQNLQEIEDILINDESIKILYIETPANPTLACFDLEGLAAIAQNFGIITIVDNTFATPYFQQPFRFGIDFVVHSGTKFLNGHGTGISGVLIGKDKAKQFQKVKNIQKTFGGISSPFEAFLLNNGLKTLPLRMEKHQENAIQLANFLTNNSKVKSVNYLSLPQHPDFELAKYQMTGSGGMLSFELDGNQTTAISFMKNLQFCTLTASLGTADTLITHPTTTSHINVPNEQRLQYNITDSLIRVSVGLENIENIIADFENAFNNL